MPVAYLWTRVVTCKNPTCKATVPLLRQTWLCKKSDQYVALKMVAPKSVKRVRFEVVEAKTEKALGFDPGLTHRNSESGLAGKPCLLVKSKLFQAFGSHIRNFSIVYWRIQCITISIYYIMTTWFP